MHDPIAVLFFRDASLPTVEKRKCRLDRFRDLAFLANFDGLAILECGIDYVLQVRCHALPPAMAVDSACLPARLFVKLLAWREEPLP